MTCLILLVTYGEPVDFSTRWTMRRHASERFNLRWKWNASVPPVAVSGSSTHVRSVIVHKRSLTPPYSFRVVLNTANTEVLEMVNLGFGQTSSHYFLTSSSGIR